MNALKQEGLGLLDYLVIKTGCMYLSDLSQKEMLCEIQHAVRELDPEAFSLWEPYLHNRYFSAIHYPIFLFPGQFFSVQIKD